MDTYYKIGKNEGREGNQHDLYDLRGMGIGVIDIGIIEISIGLGVYKRIYGSINQ